MQVVLVLSERAARHLADDIDSLEPTPIRELVYAELRSQLANAKPEGTKPPSSSPAPSEVERDLELHGDLATEAKERAAGHDEG